MNRAGSQGIRSAGHAYGRPGGKESSLPGGDSVTREPGPPLQTSLTLKPKPQVPLQTEGLLLQRPLGCRAGGVPEHEPLPLDRSGFQKEGMENHTEIFGEGRIARGPEEPG